MRRTFRDSLTIAALAVGTLFPAHAFAFDAEFDHLRGWKEQPFLYVEQASTYETAILDGETVLRVSSDGGISALVSESDFDVYETPVIEWRWRIDDFPEGADPSAEATDDFALRLYVMFQYDKGTIPLRERIIFGFAKLIYGEHPPKHVLGYVWSEYPFSEASLESTVSSRTRYLETGTGAGRREWVTVRIDAVEEYRRVHGEDPPKRARISIIGDSDSTKDATLGYVDYIRVSVD